MRTVKWGEYKASELFTPQKITKMLSKDDLSNKNKYPAYSADSTNNGIVGYTDTPEFICNEKHPIFVIFGDHTRTFNIAQESFSVLDNVKVLLPITNSYRSLLWIVTAWQKQIPNLGYARHWKIAKNSTILLPVKKGKIDFEFMENFIAELESQHMAKLEAYLAATGLNDYDLTDEERKAIQEYPDLTFEEFDVFDIFTVKNTSNILSCDIVENSGKTPYLCASSLNNGVSSYIEYDEKYLEKGNCLFIGGKSFVVSYQEKDFYSNDSHNLALYLNNAAERTRLNQLYMATCVFKSLSHKYSWGDSISKAKIKNDKISLPVKNGLPDYKTMKIFISAIQKMVIKDVVIYSKQKIGSTQK